MEADEWCEGIRVLCAVVEDSWKCCCSGQGTVNHNLNLGTKGITIRLLSRPHVYSEAFACWYHNLVSSIKEEVFTLCHGFIFNRLNSYFQQYKNSALLSCVFRQDISLSQTRKIKTLLSSLLTPFTPITPITITHYHNAFTQAHNTNQGHLRR